MMSWVKRLNAKLREMKLMAPSENLYTSHLPENRSHLLPTRDPNSPLPLPPTMPYIPPGVEPVSSSSTENSGTYFCSTKISYLSMLTLSSFFRKSSRS